MANGDWSQLAASHLARAVATDPRIADRQGCGVYRIDITGAFLQIGLGVDGLLEATRWIFISGT
jgi:hypothetical protein